MFDPNILFLVAVVVVLLVLAWQMVQAFKRTHKHKCPECGFVWQHGDKHVCSEKAHKCPNCGTLEAWKYFGPRKPSKLKDFKKAA